MAEITEPKKAEKLGNRRVHMANERTFLAWIRTSIGITCTQYAAHSFSPFCRNIPSPSFNTKYLNNVKPLTLFKPPLQRSKAGCSRASCLTSL